MIEVDYLIIGQGISGSWLAHYLLKAGKKIIIIDKGNAQSSSNVASGLINPVTGRRVVTTWLAKELLPFVWKEYNLFGDEINKKIIEQKNIIAFPAAPDLQQAFEKRLREENSYIKSSSIQKETLFNYFNFPFNVYEISPCYVVDTRTFLSVFRNQLSNKKILINEIFDESLINIKDGFIQYENIQAKKIIYADGINAANSKFWNTLPFVQNKGQALIIETDGLNTSYVYKFGHLTLIHLTKNAWWVGSSNELSFTTEIATDEFRNKTTASLTSILKTKFKVVDHWAALRPATVERRPFVGVHPVYNNIGILNGMGSKGCSIAPWFAKQLSDYLLLDKPIDASVNINRFARLLSKN